jgi:hypothetical protein
MKSLALAVFVSLFSTGACSATDGGADGDLSEAPITEPAGAAANDADGLVFYDYMNTDADGNPVLAGGVYKDPDQAAILRKSAKSRGAVPVDGYYHIRFVADAQAMDRAREFADLFLNHEAFKSIRDRFRIEYVEGNAVQMNCRNDVPQSPRIIDCDMNYILSLGAAPAHMTAVFTSRGSGGAGGGAVTIASIDYPLTTMLHEMMHTWTLQDEYIYSTSEADYYCKHPGILKGPNTTAFPTFGIYASDTEARGRHSDNIPWIDEIQVPITAFNGTKLLLGTSPTGFSPMEPGLYSGSNCSLALPSFRPYEIDNIMKTSMNTFIPPIHKQAVLAAIAEAAGW